MFFLFYNTIDTQKWNEFLKPRILVFGALLQCFFCKKVTLRL